MTKKRLSNPHLRHDGRDFYTCTLCNTGSMHRRTAVDSHLSGYGHKQNVLNEGRKQRMEMMSLNYFLLFYRIERLGLLSWKWHIKGMISQEFWCFRHWTPTRTIWTDGTDFVARACCVGCKLSTFWRFEKLSYHARHSWPMGLGRTLWPCRIQIRPSVYQQCCGCHA